LDSRVASVDATGVFNWLWEKTGAQNGNLENLSEIKADKGYDWINSADISVKKA